MNKYFERTGDPFADAGGYAIKELHEQFPDKDIRGLMDVATDVYLNHWNGKMHDFFPNSALTNPAFSKNRVEKVSEYLDSLFVKGEQGVCLITGQEGDVYTMDRTNSILTGSKVQSNCFASMSSCMKVCREVIIRNYFMPLACMRIGGLATLFISSSDETTEAFARLCAKENLTTEGVYKSPYAGLPKMMYHFIDEYVYPRHRADMNISEHMMAYQFSNFGQGAFMNITHLPCKVFDFYCQSHKEFGEMWNNLISEQDGKYNPILSNLTYGKSIVQNCRKYAKSTAIDPKIVVNYLTQIVGIEMKIAELALNVIDVVSRGKTAEELVEIEKELNLIGNKSDLRRFYVRNVKTCIKEGCDISASDIENTLNNVYYADIRDLMLVELYRKQMLNKC